LTVDELFAGKGVYIYVDDELLMNANVGKGGEIRIGAEHKLGKTLKHALSARGNVEVRI
jgi:predicted PilT family ATPase